MNMDYKNQILEFCGNEITYDQVLEHSSKIESKKDELKFLENLESNKLDGK